MKKHLLLLTAICLSVSAFPMVRTLCNMPYSPGQYTTFAAAQTASANYDTIYVHGSNVNYGTINVSKTGLVLIGTGHNPNKQAPLISSFTTINLGATNCKFIGICCDYIMGGGSFTTIKRCKFFGNGPVGGLYVSSGADNWLIEGNVFTAVAQNNIYFGGASTTNTVIRNNIFCSGNGGPQVAIGYNSTATTLNTFLILNNLFLGSANNTFTSLNNATIENNIFYRSSPQGALSTCIMNYNMSYMCAYNTFTVTGTGNLANTNPLFTNFPLAGAVFDYTHDYRLAAGSPGISTGNDGTDRGVYGGFGYKFSMTGEPAMAQITTFTITSPTIISPGNVLNISVKSKRIK